MEWMRLIYWPLPTTISFKHIGFNCVRLLLLVESIVHVDACRGGADDDASLHRERVLAAWLECCSSAVAHHNALEAARVACHCRLALLHELVQIALQSITALHVSVHNTMACSTHMVHDTYQY
jgi:hypothetical protein